MSRKKRMYSSPEACTVRILAADGSIVGTGFLVAEDAILTCAHVVAAARRLDEGAYSPDRSLAIHLDFPIVAPGSTPTAYVISWHPTQPTGSLLTGEEV